MNITESIIARFRSYKRAHFGLFPEGRKLAELKGLHHGQRCFIVGNGPSLRSEDLTRIYTNGDISFACNRIFHIFKDTPWRPTYYISQDEKVLASCVDDVNLIPSKKIFIPIELLWDSDIYVNEADYYHLDSKDGDLHPSFSLDISKSVSISKTVVYTAIQFAVYMGIHEIYLIGVDHHFHISQKSNGDIVVDPTVKDYFVEEYNSDIDKQWIPNTDESTWTYIAAQEFSLKYGFKIYNATRGGKLEVFERVDFDSLFCQ